MAQATLVERDLGVNLDVGLDAAPMTWTSAMGATPIADRDGDGLQDIAIHSGLMAPERGEVLIFGSVSGLLLETLPNGFGFRSFGADVLDLGDVNGDGMSDLAVSEPERPASLNRTGVVYVLSGADRRLIYSALPSIGGRHDFGRFLIPLALFGGAIQFDNSTGTHTTMGAFGSPVISDNKEAPPLRELGHQSQKAVPQGVRQRAGLADQKIVGLEGVRF